MNLVRKIAAGATRVAWPAARLWARRGYFRFDRPADAPRRIVVVACHWIGDTFWASQVVPLLARAWPECEITVVTKPQTVDLWNGLVAADRIVTAPEVTSDRRRERATWSGLFRKAAGLRMHSFDVALDLTGNRYSALFTFLTRPGWSLGFEGGELGWLYSRNVHDADRPGAHLSERPFRVVEPLLGRLELPEQLQPPEPTKSFQDVCGEIGLDALQPVAVLAPGAGWPEKQWPKEHFADVARQLARGGMQVITLGAASEAALSREVMGVGGAVMAGGPLGEACGLLSGAAAVVGNDSGVLHLAAPFGRRIVAIFTGATDPRRCAPRGRDVVVLDVSAGDVAPSDVVRAVFAGT